MLRPSRVKAPALIMTALALAFFGISRTSGSGWATVLVATLLGSVFAGAFLPMVRLVRSGISVHAPTDGTVSLAVPLEIDARSGLVADIPALGTGQFHATKGTFFTRPAQRGVFARLAVELRTSSPLGMVEWKKTCQVNLAAPLEVGPFPTDVELADAAPTPDIGEEDLRGIRAYVPGDSSRKLHWPATARTGEMMIRETDGVTVAPVVIVVDLVGPGVAVEPTVSRAAGLAIAALKRGAAVVLITAEPSGPVTGPVTSPLEVSRRLARAVVGPVYQPLGVAA
jgi:uncharacterized protein (DUF58 family)